MSSSTPQRPVPLGQCLLYTFVDTQYLAGRDPVVICQELCAGGADIIQLRAKGEEVAKVQQLAAQLHTVTQRNRVNLVINDYPEAAHSTGAEGCHLGQEDFFGAGRREVKEVRKDGTFWVGLSSHAAAEARRAEQAGADYVAVGPVFPTSTKPGRPAVTLEYVKWAAENVSRPWFAIGGITLENLGAVMEAGARRICVVSAILNARDVAQACHAFKKRLTSAANFQLKK